jgi:beta-galactosidase beta subunit
LQDPWPREIGGRSPTKSLRKATEKVCGDGYFLLVFPDDAHEPGLAPGGLCAPVKKVVMKVPVE